MLQGPVPSEITRLTTLEDGGADFRYNALWTTDQAVKDFMNNKQTGGDWENTQTVAPANLSASTASQSSINLAWSPIEYTYGESGSDTLLGGDDNASDILVGGSGEDVLLGQGEMIF